MNLFYSPSLSQLSALIGNNHDHFSYYDIIVEHDGEVLLEQSTGQKIELLHKYRFYFKDFLYGKSCLGIEAARNLQFLNQLYKNLMYCWENGLMGSVNFYEITRIQEFNYRMMISSSVKESKAFVPGFFKIRLRNFPQTAFFK